MDPNPGQRKPYSPISKQFDVVLNKETEARQKFDFEILGLHSSSKNVLEWWKTRDPLFETWEHVFSYLPEEATNGFIEADSKLHIHAALTLLAEIAFPNLTNDPNWARRLIKKALKKDPKYIDKYIIVLSGLIINKIKKRNEQFTLKEIEQLLIVFQMLQGNSNFSNLWSKNKFYMESILDMRTSALNTVISFLVLSEDENFNNEDLIISDSARMLALKGYIFANVDKENLPSSSRETAQKREEALSDLLSAFELLFCKPESESITISQRIKMPHVRGALHEALWYLDVIMFKHMYPEKYGAVFLMPSHSFADRPEIGKPEHNRAYDYYLTNENSGKGASVTDFIQLKSSQQSPNKPGGTKKYHPRIFVLEESNFIDVKLDRLIAKIRLYRRIIDSGFNISDAPILESYVLPTAKKHLEDFVRRCQAYGS